MIKKTTERGFELYEFEDSYEVKCSLQESSNIIPSIWLGVDNVKPVMLLKDVCIDQEIAVGWVNYPIPKEVMINSRMHLNVEQVEKLIPILQKFIDDNKKKESEE